MTTNDLLNECLRYFAHLDESNAAIHCAPVRYSPITFRLAEKLLARGIDPDEVGPVAAHLGAYEEDTGR